MLGVGCWGWVVGVGGGRLVGGGKMHMIRIDLIAECCGSKLTLKSEIVEVS